MDRVTNDHPAYPTSLLEPKGNVPKALVQGVADMASHQFARQSKRNALGSLADLAPHQIKTARNYQLELSQVNVAALPGQTPEEKAQSFEALMGKSPEYPDWMEEYGQHQRKRQIKKANQMAEGLEELLESGNKFGGETLGLSDKPMPELLESLTEEQKSVLLGLARLKDVGFKLKGRSKLKRDPEGDSIEIEEMEEFSQVSSLDILQLVDPTFDLKIPTRNFTLPVRYKRAEGKKEYILLIDRSGSMSTDVKMGTVRAMLTLLFEEVRKGEATVYMSTFEEGIDGWQKIETHEEARLAYDTFPEPRGGNTEIGDCIVEAQNEIKQGKLGEFDLTLTEPEIIIVNDGQDNVDPTTPTIAPVSAISIEQANADLETLCVRSGGKFFLC
jgi:uncharacterized protein with von Willebrand factor type A (vWA) domain